MKFHYNERVYVFDGFYRGVRGKVIGYTQWFFFWNVYQIKADVELENTLYNRIYVAERYLDSERNVESLERMRQQNIRDEAIAYMRNIEQARELGVPISAIHFSFTREERDEL